jgi:hypothetical protein
MTKSVQQYTKIFEVLQNAKAPVPVSTIRAIDGIVPTRLSTYLWEIKKNTGFAVRANRDGRTVVSYELVGAGTAPVAKPAKVKAVKPAKAPVVKAAKPVVAKAKKVTPTPVPAGDSLDGIMNAMAKSSAKKPVNLLDEIDTDVADYEDRAFAEAYIRT